MITHQSVTMYDLLMLLSRALDLVGGDLSVHGLQVAYGAWRVGEALGVDGQAQRGLALAGLVHDVGMSSSRVRSQVTASIEVDPLLATEHAVEGQKRLSTVSYAKNLADAVYFHHHRFSDPNPDGIQRDDIPLAGRILHLVDRITISIPDDYILTHRDRILYRLGLFSDSHFDPKLVELVGDLEPAFWLDLTSGYLEEILRSFLAAETISLSAEDIVTTCRLLANIIDDKSPFTHNHSVAVANVARELAARVGFSEQEQWEIEMAGLVHDLGKLAIPDEILEKPGPLTSSERQIMCQHPYHTYRILSQVPAMARIARWGALHHERLDGSGYPFGLGAEELDLGCRILAVADLFQALSQDRPYRPAMAADDVKSILASHVRENKISAELVALLLADYDEFLQSANNYAMSY